MSPFESGEVCRRLSLVRELRGHAAIVLLPVSLTVVITQLRSGLEQAGDKLIGTILSVASDVLQKPKVFYVGLEASARLAQTVQHHEHKKFAA